MLDHPGTAPVFRCQDCGSVRIDHDPGCDCAKWSPVELDEAPVQEPGLESLLREVFGITPTGIDVCLCLMDAGAASIDEVTGAVDADRSTVARHIDHLVALGVLETDERVRPGGGRVRVYRNAPPVAVKRRFRVALYAWMAAAVKRVDDLTAEKVRELGQVWTDAEEDTPETGSSGVFYPADQ